MRAEQKHNCSDVTKVFPKCAFTSPSCGESSAVSICEPTELRSMSRTIDYQVRENTRWLRFRQASRCHTSSSINVGIWAGVWGEVSHSISRSHVSAVPLSGPPNNEKIPPGSSALSSNQPIWLHGNNPNWMHLAKIILVWRDQADKKKPSETICFHSMV